VIPPAEALDQPFWDGLAAGVVRIQRCGCGHAQFPPLPACEDCGSAALDWAEASGQGTLWSWVAFHRQYFPHLPPPYTVARVKLEEGPFVLCLLEGEPPPLDTPVCVVGGTPERPAPVCRA
jgi:hypothetical protein